MKNRIQKAFIIVFALIITTPLILFALRIKVDPINKGDRKISLNFKRNFPLKSDLFQLYSDLKTDVFNTNLIPDKVIDPNNDGWLFLGNSYSNVILESKAGIVFSTSELNKLKKKLTSRKKWLNDRGIKFYVSIAPNKHSIYGEKLPIKKTNRKTKFEQLDSLCNSLNVNIINLGSKFPKNPEKPLFYKTDTHWNDYAGFHAFQATIEPIQKDFSTSKFKLFTKDDLKLEVSDTVFVGDLKTMLNTKRTENFFSLNFKNGYQSIPQDKTLDIPLNYHKDPNNYETRFSSDTNDLKIIIFNDSFMGFYSRYLRENFGNSLFIWSHVFDKKLIESEKPDIVYFEIVERDIDVLLD